MSDPLDRLKKLAEETRTAGPVPVEHAWMKLFGAFMLIGNTDAIRRDPKAKRLYDKASDASAQLGIHLADQGFDIEF